MRPGFTGSHLSLKFGFSVHYSYKGSEIPRRNTAKNDRYKKLGKLLTICYDTRKGNLIDLSCNGGESNAELF